MMRACSKGCTTSTPGSIDSARVNNRTIRQALSRSPVGAAADGPYAAGPMALKRGLSVSATRIVIGLVLAMSFSSVWGQGCEPDFAGDRSQGQQIATRLCVACHGSDGKGVAPQFPSLAAQGPEYLVKQLKAFKAPQNGIPLRPSNVMTPLVAALSDNDIVNLAAYYATLAPTSGTARDPSRIELGRKIYTAGNPGEGLPACVTCHRPTGAGIRPDFPRLAGQSAEYLGQQLTSWMAVRGKPGKLMTMIVPHLQPEEREAVADYISQLR